MSKISKSSATLFVIAACLIVVGTLKMLKSNAAPPEKENALPQRAKGNPEARIKIIEFIDFQCPACAKGVVLLRDYLKKYPDKFYVELRYFPLKMHAHGLSSAKWSECAARQEKFWPFFDLLIERQKEWGAMIDAVPSFTAIAKEAGLDQDKLNACLAEPSVDTVISADIEEGKMRNVASTPTYFVNHEMVVGMKSLQQKIDALLGVKGEAGAAQKP